MIRLSAFVVVAMTLPFFSNAQIPTALQPFVAAIKADKIGTTQPTVQISSLGGERYYVGVSWLVKTRVHQDDVQVTIRPAFMPSFHYSTHASPGTNHIVAQHVFRSPTMIVSGNDKLLTILPDLDLLQQQTPVNWYMDLDASSNKLTVGMSKSRVQEHVLYVREKGAVYPAGEVRLGFYVIASGDKQQIANPWRKPAGFFWEKWGKPLYAAGEPLQHTDLDPYVEQTYQWAFNTWKPSVWQEININGKKMGAPVFIVNVTQSPNYPGPVNEREFRSVWNQAWFHSLRSASGLYRYARRTNNDELLRYAGQTKELALHFPQKNGFFYSVAGTDMQDLTIDGKKYSRSAGWETIYFGNSNRNPYTWNAKEAPFHVLDMSVTAMYMLDWYTQLEKDERLMTYAKQYADALLGVQFKNGFFPGWLDTKSLQPLHHLNESPETALSVSFLLKLYAATKEQRYKTAALKAMDAVVRDIIPFGKWEDFETYWSCSRWGSDTLVGKKMTRNNMFKQNNLSPYWTSEALLAAYRVTGDKKYLQLGQRTLDELLMCQAVWQPPYMHIRTLGGFGVMNGDGEWNDSRQCLFAGLILEYGKLLNNTEYLQRGLSALRASFVMMYSPNNPATKQQWEHKWPFFGKEDYGFMMENYGHGGETNSTGLGIGEFTIYDWGNGAAAESYNRLLDLYGASFMEGKFTTR